MVPLSGVEPELPKERDFESRASTNSAKGAQGEITFKGENHRQMGDYTIAPYSVNWQNSFSVEICAFSSGKPSSFTSVANLAMWDKINWTRQMLRKLYDWTLSLAQTRNAERALAGVSFVESSFFPIPPDVLLIPIVLARPARWIKIAIICTVASVLGALLGYAIGMFLYETIGQPILAFYGKEDAFDKVADWYNKWGGWGILFAALTPFPYKVLTIFSGATGFNFVLFVLVSIVGRAGRFFLVAWLLGRYGEPIRLFIEKYLGLLTVLFMILLFGGFYLVRFVF